MSHMKAIVVEETGGVDKLLYKDVPIPIPKDDQVLVKNHFIGINYIDTYHRTGLYPLPLPFILGRESAGEVTQVGPGVTNFKVGDRVVCVGGDTYAEYTLNKAEQIQKITANVSYEDAAAIAIQALTAWTMVRDAYPVQRGDIVLIHAAAGGVGLLLCQMCRYLGATVIGTVSSPGKAALARENGADHVINYTHEDVVARVNEITNDLGCHAVLDGVGKDTFEISLQCARRLGTVISFGNASGVVPPISISRLTQKNLKLMRPTLFNYLVTAEERAKWWGEVFDLLANGHIRAHIYRVYDLKDAAKAHIDIESRKTTGKLLLRP
ncbi:hypothetical protein BX666DRAFT_1946680 [Dichotomocladium elegans]|nr:hypothetical protein BX666DRAFT_1946680 [Dichotomocladium elegans]